MKLFSKSKDFVKEYAVKERFLSSLLDILTGRLFADRLVRKNFLFILFLIVLGMFHISSRDAINDLERERQTLRQEVQGLRFISVKKKGDFSKMYKLSEVKKQMHRNGVELEESKEVPIRLYKE